jgi:large subunit ribosomal protein L6
MSRVASNPVKIPAGVEIKFNGQEVNVKGSKGALSLDVHAAVKVNQDEGSLTFKVNENSKQALALAGTTRALVNNMVLGVTEGFEKKLELIGVGYRAQAQGKSLNLTLGFSHPVIYELPDGVSAQTPTQTEISISGIDKQKVSQVAAEIRSIRPPEPYKGKGVRYSGEHVRVKEAKKK